MKKEQAELWLKTITSGEIQDKEKIIINMFIIISIENDHSQK